MSVKNVSTVRFSASAYLANSSDADSNWLAAEPVSVIV